MSKAAWSGCRKGKERIPLRAALAGADWGKGRADLASVVCWLMAEGAFLEVAP